MDGNSTCAFPLSDVKELHHIPRSAQVTLPFFFTHVSRIFLSVLKQKPAFSPFLSLSLFLFLLFQYQYRCKGSWSLHLFPVEYPTVHTVIPIHRASLSSQNTIYPPMAYHSRLSLRREKASFLDGILDSLRLMYYQYEVTFSTYVMTPSEKFVMNTVVLLFFSLLSVGIVSYLPQFLFRVCSRLLWLYKGADGDVTLDIGSGNGNGTSEWMQMGSIIGHHS